MYRYPGPEALYDYELSQWSITSQIDNRHYANFARFQDTVRANLFSLSSPPTPFTHPSGGILPAVPVMPLRRRQGGTRDACGSAWGERADIRGVLCETAAGLQAAYDGVVCSDAGE